MPLTRPAVLLGEGRPDRRERRKSSLATGGILERKVSAFSLPDLAHRPSAFSIVPTARELETGCECIHITYNHIHIPGSLLLDFKEKLKWDRSDQNFTCRARLRTGGRGIFGAKGV